MQNPFKVGEPVVTKLKTKEVEAVITQVWRNEVQVRTANSELLWRTMYTVWRPGEAPLKRERTAPPPTPVQNDPMQQQETAGSARRTKRAASKSKSPKST
ncbi:hypothetical protein BH18VER1_BH18VER1_16560 [soil metagenome]